MNELTFDPQSHTYYVDNRKVISVTQVLKEAGLVNFYGNASERNRNFGIALHQAIHYFDIGTLNMNTLHPELLPYLNGWEKFKKEFGFEVQESEKRMYSKRWLFTGTPDKIGLRKGKKAIVEIKSGPIIKYLGILQLAGYLILEDENNPRVKVKERIGVQLLPDSYKIEIFNDVSDCSSFLAFLQTVRFKQKYNIGGLNYGKH